MTVYERDMRKRLLISRHIAKMTPEEIERRFTVYVVLSAAIVPKNRRKSAAQRANFFLVEAKALRQADNHRVQAFADAAATSHGVGAKQC